MAEVEDSAIIDVSGGQELHEMISIREICRLCANQNDKLIGIFSVDGINNDLATKMNLYLPIKVYETDELPLQCCWQCASTVLAWHELVVTSIEADRRLRSYNFVTDKQLQNVEDCYEDDASKSQEEHSRLNSFCQTDSVQDEIEKTNITGTFVVTSDNLTELVALPTQYITLGNNIYSIKPEEVVSETNKVLENSNKDEHIEYYDDNEAEDNEADETEQRSDNENLKEREVDNEYLDCQKHEVLELRVENLKKREEKHLEIDRATIENAKKEKRKNSRIDQDVVNAAKVVVDGKVYYNCKECGRSLHSPYTYIWHMRIHTGERPHSCTICGRQFRVSQGLIRHIKETHERIKNFACDLCGRLFATKRNVEEHRRIHTNERPYVCDLCGKSFKQKASLFVHNRSHSDYFPFKCQFCDQVFRTKPPLRLHITKHTGEKPYACEICGRKFRIKYELKRHRLIHSDEKPFSCKVCGLKFKQMRYLRNHSKLNHLLTVDS